MTTLKDVLTGYAGVVACWTMDETAGTTAVDGVAGRSGTYTGAVTLNQRQLAPNGPQHPTFGGGYVTIPTDAVFSPDVGSSGKLSVFAVVYATALNSAQMVLTKSNPSSGNGEWQFRVNSDGSVLLDLTTGFGFSAVHQTQTPAGVVVLNTVAVLLGTFDAASHTSTIYLNGVQQSQATGALGGTLVAGNAPVEIGRRNDTGGNPWAGNIGYAAVFSTDLTQTDATALYQAFLDNTGHLVRSASDDAPAVDTAVRSLDLSRVASDDAPAVDTASRSLLLPRVGADDAPAVDTEAHSLLLPREGTDNALAVDTADRSLSLPRAISDGASAVDIADRSLSLPRVGTDAAPAVDTASRLLLLPRVGTDGAPAIDSASWSLIPRAMRDGIAYGYENVGVEAVRLTDGVSYGYFGEVTANMPEPHIWYIIPTHVPEGGHAAVAIVGLGFGDTDLHYMALVYLGASQVPQMDIIEWANIFDDGVASKVIDSALDIADPEHQRITMLVPYEAETDFVTVHTFQHRLQLRDAVDSAPAVDVASGHLATLIRSATDSASAVDSATGVILLTTTRNYTGSPQTFVVPAGVHTLTVDAYGAAGGSDNAGHDGGKGGRVKCDIAVTPGETLQINVGGCPGWSKNGGWNGGGQAGDLASGWTPSCGGGGATDIRRGANALADRLVVAGGGGGSAHSTAGVGGYANGTDASNNGTFDSFEQGANGGQGGTQTAGGAGGLAYWSGTDPSSTGSPGTLGQGGKGGFLTSGSGGDYDGGGGGGGYYGGGGGGRGGWWGGADGGGGSGLSTGVNQLTQNGVRASHGTVTLTWVP